MTLVREPSTLVPEPYCNSMRTSFASGDVPKSAQQPSERHLDEEALLRMDDDEGGSNDPAVNPPDTARKAAPGQLEGN
jgi:hypothetical protein